MKKEGNEIVGVSIYSKAEEVARNFEIDVVVLDFSYAFEATRYLKILTLITFISEKNPKVQIIAMYESPLEERVAKGFRVTNAIKKPGVEKLREI